MDIKKQDCYTTIAMKGSEVDQELKVMVLYGHIEKHSNVILMTESEYLADKKKTAEDAKKEEWERMQKVIAEAERVNEKIKWD